MKKLIWLFILLVLFSSYSFAREWLRNLSERSYGDQNFFSKEKDISDIENNQKEDDERDDDEREDDREKEDYEEDRDNNEEENNDSKEERQKQQLIKKNAVEQSWACFTWKQLMSKNQLSNKIKASSDNLNKLLPILSKIWYSSQNIIEISNTLSDLSLQINQDCSSSDIKQHRDQIKETLTDLKNELVLLKQYIIQLRKK